MNLGQALRFGVVGVLGAFGVGVLGLVTYSYFHQQPGLAPRVRGETAVNTSQLILTTPQGAFLDKGMALEAGPPAPRLGFLAPDFTLDDLEGRPVSLSDFRGKPVLVNFWATWCPPCRKEMPELQRFAARYGDQVQLLGVNWGESQREVVQFLQRYGVSYPNLMDRAGRAFVLYRLTGLPESFWVDENGFIRGVWSGAMTEADILTGFKKITAALGGS